MRRSYCLILDDIKKKPTAADLQVKNVPCLKACSWAKDCRITFTDESFALQEKNPMVI